jgi:hypothetical protein
VDVYACLRGRRGPFVLDEGSLLGIALETAVKKVPERARRRMTIHDQETDPSTPGSRRSPGSRAASTDPGVGPPSGVADSKPTGVVVPPPGPRNAPVAVLASSVGKKDSVELLLEGMAGPRPDRVKTMPRTSGEASAAYHAEHAVHPAHTLPDEQPKVMVERAPFEARDSTDPSTLLLPLVEVPPGWRAADPTYVPPKPLGPRVAVATLAGAVVVLGLFVSLDRPRQPDAAGTAALPSAPSTPAAMPAEPAPAPTATPPVEPLVQASSGPSSTPLPPLVAAPSVPPGAPRRSSHANNASPRPSPPSGDLGEFKTTF